MPPTLPDPVAGLAAIDADAITEAAAAGLLAGGLTDEGSRGDAAIIGYLEHLVNLGRVIPDQDLLTASTNIETLIERLQQDDVDDVLEECVDELIVLVIGPFKGALVPDEATTEAAVLAVEGMISVAVARLFKDITLPAKVLRH